MSGFGAWFGSDLTKVFFLFSPAALKASGKYDMAKLEAEFAGRTKEQGAFDGHPFVMINPVLSVEDARRAKRDTSQKETVRYVGEHAEIDVDKDPDYPLRKLAIAIEDAGGDWGLYHGRLTEEMAKQMGAWASLTMPQKVGCLRRLAEGDVAQLSKLCNRASQPTELEVGK